MEKYLCPDCKTELEPKEYADIHEGDYVYNVVDMCPECKVVVYDPIIKEDLQNEPHHKQTSTTPRKHT